MNDWIQKTILNQDKSYIIVFGNKENRNVCKYLETASLKTKDHVQNLGVLLDSDLTVNSLIKSYLENVILSIKEHIQNKRPSVLERPGKAHT